MEERASKKKREEPIDRISGLSDDIGHHILSFLPVNLIAQTGILSKRWSYLWRSFPTLDFANIYKKHLNQENQGIPLDSAIISVLLNRQQGSNIKLFRLKGSVSSPSLLICLGLLVSDHEFEELDLDVPLINHFQLPHYLFSYEPLRALTLKSNNPSTCFTFSTSRFIISSGLKSLHTLSLTRVNFTPSPLFDDLFSDYTFPSLERLYLCHCKGIDSLNISCSNLEELEISDLNIKGLEVFCTKLEVLKVVRCLETSSRVQRWVNIVAPQLQTFFWQHNAVPESCRIESFPHLNLWKLSFRSEVPTQMVLLGVATIVSAISFTKSLNAPLQIIWLLARIDFAGIRLDRFNDVTNLLLQTGLNKHEIPGVACLLRCCPKLRKLNVVIRNDLKNGQDIWNREDLDNVNMTEERYWLSQFQSQKSMLEEQLECVTIIVYGSVILESTLNLAKFLLGHGRVLKTMQVYPLLNDPRGPSPWQQTVQRIMEFRRASPVVKLILRSSLGIQT